MATENKILGHSFEEWEPMPPNQGPPFPEWLGIYWPWYKQPVGPVPPVASFTVDHTSGYAPLIAVFNNMSTGDITGYHWDFGDGTSSSEVSPSHTYNNVGSYAVTLKATGPGGEDTYSLNISVTERPEVEEGTFEIRVVNAPAGSIGWNCSVMAEGYYYQFTNPWIVRDGIVYLLLSESAVFRDVPGSSGQLNISACSGASQSGEYSFPIIIAQEYGIPFNFETGRVYTYDFNTRQLT